jgi:hypothetical protein
MTGPGPANGSAKLDELEQTEAAAKASEGRRASRYSFVGRLSVLVAIIVVVGLFGGFYVVLNTLRDTQTTMVAIQRQTRACVTPGTACSDAKLKQDQATIAAIVGGTNEFALYGAYCANRLPTAVVRSPDGLDKIRACVTRLLNLH